MYIPNFNSREFNFKDDLSGEHAVNQFLVKYLYERLKDKKLIADYEVITELNQQHAGMDTIITTIDDKHIAIDEKSAIHYAQTDLEKEAMPTFAFEVSYEHNGGVAWVHYWIDN